MPRAAPCACCCGSPSPSRAFPSGSPLSVVVVPPCRCFLPSSSSPASAAPTSPILHELENIVCSTSAPIAGVDEISSGERKVSVQGPSTRPLGTAAPAKAGELDALHGYQQTTAPMMSANDVASGLVSRLKFGVASDEGCCGYMEDAHVVHAPAGADFAFGCVFDGHGGHLAAQFCKERLHFNVMGSAAFAEGDARTALRDGFGKTEADLLAEQREGARRIGRATGEGADCECDGEVSRESSFAEGGSCCGTTALVALVMADKVHLAWAGDCRAVLCRGGTAVPLTSDHSIATNSSEAARVVSVGGEIDGGRLGGCMEVSRALGDLEGATGCKPAGLSGEPELRSEALQPDDEFLLMGSDGLFGVLESDEAVRLARDELRAYGDASMASEKLVEVALKRHADDNITALLICLNPIAALPERVRPRLRLKKSDSVHDSSNVATRRLS
ncbi:hypothetical protein AB1Y20_003335 [Prymnesium parvum]|uniref:PPM-type phosphatase domain-containing protein n=1 Tax=Prymnesium parvum TaxID=97485 RepID=A0AB34JDN0_PRYPA